MKITPIIVTTCLFLLFGFERTSAQQWVDKKYSVDTTLNVAYGTALNFNNELDTLRMDLYLPQCDDSLHISKRPLLIWIHGGAFLAGSKEDASISNLCRQFARRGYVCASLNYRLGFVSDTASWTCNYPNYSCVFAADTAEWIRAWYRGVQDAKGALRFLVHRAAQYRIDADNVFLAGESAGSFVALGAALLDSSAERPTQTFALSAAALPAANARTCMYNTAKHFGLRPVARQDLGDISGSIESDDVDYTIKAIGNNYGGMIVDLLRLSNPHKAKPAIYNFHQPCDLVVPIDSGTVYQGLSWCMTNGYGCYAIVHSPKVYGSRTLSHWNAQRNYGYEMHDEFSTTDFPYSFVLGSGSCLDQVNTPCHAYDNATLRENNLAAFFAKHVSTTQICDSTNTVSVAAQNDNSSVSLTPQPAGDELRINYTSSSQARVELYSLCGERINAEVQASASGYRVSLGGLTPGVYFVVLSTPDQLVQRCCFVHR